MRTIATATVLLTVTMAGPAAAAPPPLRAYAEADAAESINGYRFIDHPTVRRALAVTVPNAVTRARVIDMLDQHGVGLPVAVEGRWVVAAACLENACETGSTTVVVNAVTGRAAVCFHAENARPAARWFLANGKTAPAGGQCPSEPAEIPRSVLPR